MKYLRVILLTASCFVFCESAFVETLTKCSIKDNECLKFFYQSLIIKLGNDGASEIGIERIDPLELNDVTVTILEVFNVTMVKGTVEGVKTCVITSFENNLEDRTTKLKTLCERLIVQGQYNLRGAGSLFKEDIDDDVSGDGNAKVVLDKVEVHLEYPFHVEKHDDGDVYMKIDFKNSKYGFQVIGNASFDANNLSIGNRNASNEIVKYLNENWKVIMQTFGKSFLDVAIQLFLNSFSNKFFNNVSVKHFIQEDLLPYVK